MISIIICSRTQKISSDLSENIKNTVGCEYELIVVDNSENHYSIFEAYNLGIDKSKGAYLCFIHDDILFHTKGWGNVIQGIFDNDQQIGLIGVAGTKIKTKMPSAWWDCPENQYVINIIQHYDHKEKLFLNYGFVNTEDIEVAAIDGVFMAMRKESRIRFDNTMKGFHNYDLNISFEYKNYGYKVVVSNKILIEHFSPGVTDEKWIRATYKIHNLYRKKLPLFASGYVVTKDLEIINAQRFITMCLDFGFKKMAVLVWFRLFLLQPYSKFNNMFWKRIRNTILR
jgi:glycosyltransferase involved in cell wall biosynthesis